MKVQYRKRFLKDLKALKNQPVYEQILQLAFRDLPNAKSLQDIGNVKPMKGAKYLSKINYTYLTTSCLLPLAFCLSSLGN
ncbi:MAG UNVERIFIED_CONTAM: hypothetical protein LVR29_21120 [Microcystis novacekii LVE1205-3]